jgi:hypothetical protein
MRLELVHLALVGGAHRAPRAIDHGGRVDVLTRPQFGELAVAGFEDALHAARVVAVVGRALKQCVEVAAGPEFQFELVGAAARAADGERFAEDPVPAHEDPG